MSGPMSDQTTDEVAGIMEAVDSAMETAYEQGSIPDRDEVGRVRSAVEAAIRKLADDRDRWRRNSVACEVCWTCSWAPCPEGTTDAVRDPHSEGRWMVCQMCFCDGEARRWRTDSERLADAVADFLNDRDHVVDIRDNGWSLQHPPQCRPNMLDCPYHERARDWDGPPWKVGRWVMPFTGNNWKPWIEETAPFIRLKEVKSAHDEESAR